MNQRELCNAYVNRTVNAAKSSALSFEDNVMYSYSTAIAAMGYHELSGVYALVSSDNYSVTTSKHLSYLHAALSRNTKIIYVMNVPSSPDGVMLKSDHRRNYQEMVVSLDSLKEDVIKCRYDSGNFWSMVAGTKAQIEQMNLYTKMFKLGYKAKAWETPTKEEHTAAKKVMKAKRDKIKALAQKKLERRIKEWCKGQHGTYAISNTRRVYLRVVETPSKTLAIETSRGIVIGNIKQAKAVWQACLKAVETKTPISFERGSFKLGLHSIDKIDADGKLHAGCHHIEFEQVEQVAKTLGYK